MTGARPSTAGSRPGRCGVCIPSPLDQNLPPWLGLGTDPLIASYQYNIPKCIPNGEYLLRIQSLAIHNPGSTPQFYVSCAQISVTGGGNTNPSPTVKIPGAFKATDPGYTANVSADETPCSVRAAAG
jgi:hypothetical protein